MGDPSKIDLRSLRYVAAVAATGSFARAAETLGITQPALSRSVRVLETALGVRLFDRGRSGTFVTSFGRLLVERGRGLLANAGAIERELRLLDGAEVGTLAVGAAAYPASICVGLAAGRLIAQHPGLELRIAVADWPELIRRVLAEELDLAICEYGTAEADERLVTEALPVHEACLFCRAGHPLETITPINLAAVRRYPMVLNSVPARSADLVGGRRREAETSMPQIHVDTFDLSRQIVLESDAIGVASRAQIAVDLRDGRLVALAIRQPWLSSRYGFVHRAGRTLAPSAKAFMANVREVERAFSEAEHVAPHGSRRPAAGPASNPPKLRPTPSRA